MESVYFIAVVPPPDIREEITRIKEMISREFGSSHALRSPPHITLHMPFKWKENKLRTLLDTLGDAVTQTGTFQVELKNFNCFRPRVIYVDVVENEQLDELQKKVVRSMRALRILNADYKNKPFHPHMTVAFRDLRKSKFFEAWKEFKDREIRYDFQVDELVLLKHDGKKWNIFESFKFV